MPERDRAPPQGGNPGERTLLLYDLTPNVLEGKKRSLARRGHSGDGKKGGRLQVVFGLVCSGGGCPVAVEVFLGSMSDPVTLTNQVEKIRNRFGLTHLVPTPRQDRCFELLEATPRVQTETTNPSPCHSITCVHTTLKSRSRVTFDSLSILSLSHTW